VIRLITTSGLGRVFCVASFFVRIGLISLASHLSRLRGGGNPAFSAALSKGTDAANCVNAGFFYLSFFIPYTP